MQKAISAYDDVAKILLPRLPRSCEMADAQSPAAAGAERGTMMEPIECLASLHRISKDQDGEVTLTLKIPASSAPGLFAIETGKVLCVHITAEAV